MKSFQFFTVGFVFVLIFSAFAFAQTEKAQTVTSNKIAIINSERFYDEKLGIHKLALAEKQMGRTDCVAFFKYYSASREIEELQKEVIVLEYQKLPTKNKLDELEKLKDENEKARKTGEDCISRVRTATVDSIIEDIRRKLKEFAKQKGYSLVIDGIQDNSFYIIDTEYTQYTDITTEFIKYYNEKFVKIKTQ